MQAALAEGFTSRPDLPFPRGMTFRSSVLSGEGTSLCTTIRYSVCGAILSEHELETANILGAVEAYGLGDLAHGEGS